LVAIARGEFTPIPLSLGPCECPNNVHGTPKKITVVENGKNVEKSDPESGGDSIRYKSRLDFGAWRKVNAASPDERTATLFLQAIMDWNLVDYEGEPVPVTLAGLDRLSLRQSGILVGTIDTPEYVLGDIMKDFDPNGPAGAGDSPAPAKTTTDSSESGPSDSSSS